MKNIDKIRGMSAEELGAFLGKAINQCSLCHYQDIPECSGNCEKGITKWLNAKCEKTMPEIKAGDMFVYRQSQIPFYGACVYGNIVYLPGEDRCYKFCEEIKEKIIVIKRYNPEKGLLEDIWRDENAN
jgi:hypothetical protein